MNLVALGRRALFSSGFVPFFAPLVTPAPVLVRDLEAARTTDFDFPALAIAESLQ
jgi:hypothetical protein